MRVLKAILVGGFSGGLLDLCFAIGFAVSRGGTPARLLQTIASGVFGETAYSGGSTMAAYGAAFHFLISFAWAALFVLVAARWPALTRHPVAAGAAFGVLVFLAMRLVVLPASAFPHPVTFPALATTLDLASHMLLFGVPIALAARRASGRSRPT